VAEPATMRREPRQARGQQRIDTILDAAEMVLGEVGVEAITTNAIAARANTSIGSLYQFFPNKEAVLRAVGLRFLDRTREIFTPLLSPPAAAFPLDEWIDRMADALNAAQKANPAFKVLFCSPLLLPELAGADTKMHDQFVAGLDSVFAVRRPDLDPARRLLYAKICVQTAEGLMPLLSESQGDARAKVLDELKALLTGYLRPVFA
jgi:AcrR family transcriptional regulator